MLNDQLPRLRLSLLALLLSPLFAHADGWGDLKDALAKHTASTPFKAQVDVKTWNKNGEGKSAQEQSGQAGVFLEENAAGLRIQFSRDTLNRLSADEFARDKDPRARTPTLGALNALNATELRQMANAGAVLARLLEKTPFKSERADVLNGKPVRVLSFEMGPATLSEKDRKYVKSHDGTLEVSIAADGTPLASHSHLSVSGRAYLVVSFEGVNDEDVVYATVGDRIVAARKEGRSSGSGAGEHSESRTVRTLQLQP
jgi:hypothetical protein